MTDAPANLTRREFVRRSAAAGTAGLAVPMLLPAVTTSCAVHPPTRDKIRLGIIGAGPMGQENLANCAKHGDVVVTAVCDVIQERRDAVAALHPGSKTYRDYRELLASNEVDAVIVASPPHWHTLHAIAVCEAGKDLYLQKPMTLYPDESLAVRNAVRKHQRICQIGTQIHATENYRRVVEYLRSGKLGQTNVVRTFNVMNQGPEGIGNTPGTPVPAGIDWENWVGPAPMRPFHEIIVRDAYYHSSFMAYSGGWTPGMAPHLIDLPFWAFDLDYPTVTHCSGGRTTLQDMGDVPDTQEVVWQFGNRVMTWSMSLVNSFGFDFGRGTRDRRIGIYFQGVNGTLFCNYNKFEVVAEGDRLPDAEKAPPAKSLPSSPGHEREWLDCIKTRTQPSCNADYHGKIDMALALANLSLRLGRSIRFDPRIEKIVGDAEAVKLARPVYRAPWVFPAQYV